MPQVTEEIAITVLDLYPTLLSLAHAYSILVSHCVCSLSYQFWLLFLFNFHVMIKITTTQNPFIYLLIIFFFCFVTDFCLKRKVMFAHKRRCFGSRVTMQSVQVLVEIFSN